MKEIKFKAWNGKSFFYPSKLLFQDDGSLTHVWDWNNGDFSWQSIKNYELVQYTGLKDKNGKEIYEGDIVRLLDIDNEPEIFTVIWEKSGYFTLKPFVDNEGYVPTLGYFTDRDSNDNYYTFEIIGNIYKNPELLKSKKEKNNGITTV